MTIAIPATARRPAARPQPAAGTRRAGGRNRPPRGRAAPQPTLRERVETAFRTQANGAPAPAAHAATREFYRASGFSWARALG
jgi:hypothetical protein